MITLGVADLEKSVAYYSKLGWTQAPSPEDGEIAFFQLRGQVMSLYPAQALAKELGRDPANLGTGGVSLSQNHPTEAGVDEAIKAALAAGGALVQDAKKQHWGGYSGYVSDPDGHIWEYAFNPWWPLDDEGGVTLP
jgi:predicted lactoylglutathione lyase